MELERDWMDRLPGVDGRSEGGPARVTDLRRRRREESAEEIVRSAQYLPSGERVLIESVFRDGRRVSDMARLIAGPGRPTEGQGDGMTGCRARALRARVRRLVRRMLTPEYRAVARWMAIEKLSPGAAGGARGLGGALRRRVAVACFLHGLPIREAARELGLSLHTVRRHRDAVAAMAQVAVTPGPGAGRATEVRS